MHRLNNKFFLVPVSLLVIFAVSFFITFTLANNRPQVKVAGQTVTASILGDQAGLTKVEITETPIPTPSVSATAAPEPVKEESKATSPEPEPEVITTNLSAPSYGGAFQWGVTMRPHILGKYSAANWSEQIKKAKELGVGWGRINWDYDNSDPVARNSQVIDALKSNGINPVLVIEHNPAKGNSNLYAQGLADAKTITGALRSKVDFYQLANEGGAESLIGGKSGVSASDYDDARYNNVKDYIKGLSDGIAAGDPGAQRIVTISWIHSGFLDRLVSDGVNFDMIGIDWYSWMGSFGAKKISNNETLYHKLQTFGKPLTFMEVSTMPTADGDEKYKTNVNQETQANFLVNTGRWAWNNRDWVKGFYHFELVDNTFSVGFIDYYGLIGVKTKDGVADFGDVRQAFYAYKDLIAGR